ncbi:efflux RND transporter periplasmic adaptor subunit [Paenibacillus sp. WLX1005]|uniref:efflux RND transporter periplasmic adaptor subunit n=1 Tax=Paenibacillus sp. WLX1005 TaxID=3243766 RepID=UPI0039842385
MNRKWPMAFTSVVLVASLAACSSEPAAVEPTTSTVQMTTVKEQPLNASYDLSGTLIAYEQTPVSFQTAGTVLSVSKDIGDTVSKGEVIARLDTADLQLSLQNAQEDVSAANASLASAKASLSDARAGQQSAAAGVSSAQAKLESARISEQDVQSGARSQELAQAQNAVSQAQTAYNQAKTEATRSQTLLDNGLMTQQDYEKAQTALSDAQTSLNDVQEKLSLTQEGSSTADRAKAASAVKEAEVGIQSAQASVEQANAAVSKANAGVQQSQAAYDQKVVAVQTAKLNLSRASMKAPASGTILEKNLSVGQSVSAGGGGGSNGSSPLFQIGDISKLKVQLPVADSDIASWKVGQQVSVQLYNDVRTGKVTSLSPQTNENTGSINVEVVISNPQRDWKPGQVVNASRQTSAQQGILLPTEAVISSGNDPYVFKAVNGKAVQTTVKLGEVYNNQYQITSGLKVGDKVVTSGADRLFNGDEITTGASDSSASNGSSTTGANETSSPAASNNGAGSEAGAQ